MTRARFVRAFKAAARKVLLAEKALDKAEKEYDDLRSRMRKIAEFYGWQMPRTNLTNPFRVGKREMPKF